ncbi:MAG: NnrU family protein [Methylobacterium frigidaeris]
MTLLLAGLVLFLGTHAFTMLRGPRARLIARFGEAPYKLGYTLVAALGLVLIGVGYGHYRAEGYIPVWSPPVWTRHLALLLMLPAFVCLAAAYLPGRIKARLKHPMLLGVKIWATAHLLANGDLGSIVLFAAVLAWAVAARISAKRRDEVRAHAGPATSPRGWRNDALAAGIGLASWLLFARVLHPWLIGVAVWPGQA